MKKHLLSIIASIIICAILLIGCGGGGGGGGGTAPAISTSSVNVTIPGSLFDTTSGDVRAQVATSSKMILKVVAYLNGKTQNDIKITDREATYNGTDYKATVDGLTNVYDYRFTAFYNNKEVLNNQVSSTEIANDASFTVNIDTSFKTLAYDSWLKKNPTNASMKNFKDNSKEAGYTKDSDYNKLTLQIGNENYTTEQFKTNLKKVAKGEEASLPTSTTSTINVDAIAITDKEKKEETTTNPTKPTSSTSYIYGQWQDKQSSFNVEGNIFSNTIYTFMPDGSFTGYALTRNLSDSKSKTIVWKASGYFSMTDKSISLRKQKYELSEASETTPSMFARNISDVTYEVVNINSYVLTIKYTSQSNIEKTVTLTKIHSFSNSNDIKKNIVGMFSNAVSSSYSDVENILFLSDNTYISLSGEYGFTNSNKFEKILKTKNGYYFINDYKLSFGNRTLNISDINKDSFYDCQMNGSLLYKRQEIAKNEDIKNNLCGGWKKWDDEEKIDIIFYEDGSFFWTGYDGNKQITGKYNIENNYIRCSELNDDTLGELLWIPSEISSEKMSIFTSYYESEYTKCYSIDKIVKEKDLKQNLYGGWGNENGNVDQKVTLMFNEDGTFFWKYKWLDKYEREYTGKFSIENNIIVLTEEDTKFNWLPLEITKDKLKIYSSEGVFEYSKLKDITSFKFGGGSGTEQDPYLIKTADHFDSIRYFEGKHFKQIEDIDLASFIKINDGWNPIDFYGSYNGNYKKIKGLWINTSNKSSVGLFGNVGLEEKSQSIIKNIILEIDSKGIKCDDANAVGGIAGSCQNTIVENCYVKGDIDATIKDNYLCYCDCGGIIGECVNSDYNVAVSKSCYTGNIKGDGTIGGIIGSNNSNININNCFSICNIEATSSAGGIIGDMGGEGLIKNCYSSSYIDGHDVFGIGGQGYFSDGKECKNCIAINPFLYCDGYIGYTYEDERFLEKCYYINNTVLKWKGDEDEGYQEYHKRYYLKDNGEPVEKAKFWGSSTKDSFWKSADYLNWTDFDDNWEFRAGYNLPQLKNLPSIKEPDGIN